MEARLMEETLVLNRSLDPLYGDYIKLNDLNVPLEFRRDQADDLMPTIEEFVEDMDPYLDEGMGEVVVGEPFCEVSCVETRRFDESKLSTEEYESVSEQDKMNGSSHPYQKLKGFYKGVLNLEPNFIRDPKMEEWLTHGHISVHEME
ncbi:hypothetical protein Tco_0481123 [Tanacetum coccineum]